MRMSDYTNLVRAGSVAQICQDRATALALYQQALDTLAEANAAMKRATASERAGVGGWSSFECSSYRGMPDMEDARKDADRAVWRYLIDLSGIKHVMDAQALKEFRERVGDDPPPATEDAVRDTLTGAMENAELMFQRGLVNTFKALGYAYKRNHAFKLNRRIAIDRGWSGSYGSWARSGSSRFLETVDHIRDLERILYVLDKKTPPERGVDIEARVSSDARGKWNSGAMAECDYLKVQTYKKGSVHITVKRDDLLERCNDIIADYCSRELPDGRTERAL